MDQYETLIWQVVPIQVHLRLKLDAIAEAVNKWQPIKCENIKEECITDADEEPLTVATIDAISTVAADDTAPNTSAVPSEEMANAIRKTAPSKPTPKKMTKTSQKAASSIGNTLTKKMGKATQKAALSRVGAPAQSSAAAPFSCPDCSKTFNQKEAFDNHHRRIHTGEQPLKCQLCNARFSSTRSYRTHKANHLKAGDRFQLPAYPCRICSKEFHQKLLLIDHVRDSHGGAKPYACDQCDFDFDSTERLSRHRMSKHGDGTERKFICDYCQKGFIHLLTLSRSSYKKCFVRNKCIYYF